MGYYRDILARIQRHGAASRATTSRLLLALRDYCAACNDGLRKFRSTGFRASGSGEPDVFLLAVGEIRFDEVVPMEFGVD
jgi:hypothetical protein